MARDYIPTSGGGRYSRYCGYWHFGSEYVVASKQIGHTDFTLGLGWGRLAGKGAFFNPLRALDDRFGTRPGSDGVPGEFSLGKFFSGDQVGILAVSVILIAHPLLWRWNIIPISMIGTPDLVRHDQKYLGQRASRGMLCPLLISDSHFSMAMRSG